MKGCGCVPAIYKNRWQTEVANLRSKSYFSLRNRVNIFPSDTCEGLRINELFFQAWDTLGEKLEKDPYFYGGFTPVVEGRKCRN